MIICIFVILQFLAIPAAWAQAANEPKDFPFTQFDVSDYSSFHFRGSSIAHGALQVTPDSENLELTNKSGRITYKRPYRLWSSDIDDVVASFNTHFVINIFRNNEWEAGEGLAFVIAPDYEVPENSYGQWLGLTNDTTDGDTENKMVAIEFDTKKQDFDPDNDHIGLNINTIKSKKNVSLNGLGIDLAPHPDKVTNYSVWIQYDGKTKAMEVFMAATSGSTNVEKPVEPILNDTINLKDYVKEESYFGFSASTGNPDIQLNCVWQWNLEVEVLPVKKDRTWLKIVIGVGVPGIVLLGLICVMLGLIYKKKRKRAIDEESLVLGTLKSLPGIPREFRYKDLKKATNNFHESMKLGQGGFGVVYRGVLHEKDGGQHGASTASTTASTTEIAVKRFSRDNVKGQDDFFAELTIIHRLRHKHLVRLLGWSHEKGKLLLVYEFMPNGSLEKHLYDSSNPNTLHWSHRCKILTGVASALHYLHNEYDQKVVHRDLKASNILLDSHYNARLGDFGLARVLDNERNSYAELELGGVPGTMGYVAPECFHTGKATPESDVYGFGAVVLEVISGRSPGVRIHHEQQHYSLVDWVWMLHREGRIQEAVDKRLQNDYNFDEANRLLLLGLACSHPIDSERPQTPAIYQILSGTLPAPHVRPFKPVFTWPSMVSTFSTSDTTLFNITSSTSS
ncbi:probable L-type lectin-domain containing receptor kinase S.5 [Ziziphus jujuba]|uniref:Probable L-type lectin-domain containing receptor kinase S.5 n=1 Tax=Ziziphus jujuba TaxID=326968 RepID=A0ABM3I8D6_ZIZJJ|nr:probable L-type lectin-domain containing receptor kinase S.5 [Ziziphus jujuba]